MTLAADIYNIELYEDLLESVRVLLQNSAKYGTYNADKVNDAFSELKRISDEL